MILLLCCIRCMLCVCYITIFLQSLWPCLALLIPENSKLVLNALRNSQSDVWKCRVSVCARVCMNVCVCVCVCVCVYACVHETYTMCCVCIL